MRAIQFLREPAEKRSSPLRGLKLFFPLHRVAQRKAILDGRPANPRLQRTPSAAPPSPLSRKPLARIGASTRMRDTLRQNIVREQNRAKWLRGERARFVHFHPEAF